MNPPPDVIFAQKATAIVKAAGMDPRTIDLERFRQNASLVFSRAYSAIYKEKLLTVLNENSSKEDKILNSQLVLDGLFTKTRNPILLQLSGQDLFDGSHRAIGVLVGILFAEGQRLWLEKIKSMEATLPSTSMDETQHEHNRQIQTAQEVLDSNEDISLLHEDDNDESQGFGGHEIRESLRTLNKMRSNPDIAPVEMERLLSRIAFLEEQLKHRPKKLIKKKTQKKHIVRRISEAILQDNEINQQGGGIGGDHSSDEDDTALHTTRSSPQNHNDRRNRRPESSNSPTRRLHSSGGGGIASSNNGIKSRPVSAPSHRRATKGRTPSHRLYNTALGKKDQQYTTNTSDPHNNEQQKTHRVYNRDNEDAHKIPTNNTKIEYFDPSIHTYDWKSGRKILISQAQIEYEERKRQKDAMENILAISENEVDDLMGGGGKNSPNKTAQYPSKSISGDVDKWLQRMGRHRYNDNKRNNNKSSSYTEENLTLPEPRYFAAYQKLEDRDLIITIEHCYNCSHHNVTTRHKQEEYLNYSTNYLRILSQIAHDCNICARVGVSRFKANITETCSTSDENTRIGAFEIQVAYKQHNGKVIPVTLHSKLASRRWPSKTVLEKRFRAFIAHAKISTVQCDLPPTNVAVQMASDSAEQYPVGPCRWTSSPLADPGWSFATTEAKTIAATAAATAATTTAGTSHSNTTAASTTTTASISNVQWAFDMRELSDAPAKFTIGSTIRVKKLPFSSGNIERHALLCVVKEYIDPNDIDTSDLLVKPMYHAQEVKVPQRNCINLVDYTDREVEYTEDTVPVELATLILLGKQYKLLTWDVSRGEGKTDSNGDICLSRRAFYNQVRKLSWAVEKKHPSSSSKGKGLFAHPQNGVECDIQHSYSEEVIEWVFNAFKGEGNVSALERMVTPKLSSSTKSAKQSSVSNSSNGNGIDSTDPTPRTARTSAVSVSSAPPSADNVAATTSVSQNTDVASPLPDSSAHTADTKETSSLHSENALQDHAETVDPTAASEPPGKESPPSTAYPVAPEAETPATTDIPVATTTTDAVEKSTLPPTDATQAAVETAKPAPAEDNPKQNNIPQEGAAGANTEEAISSRQAEQPVGANNPDDPAPESKDVPSQQETQNASEHPPTVAAVPPDTAPAPTDTTATTQNHKPITHRASSVPAKRFSSADLVGAVDQALKSKIITALSLPDHPYNPSLTAMERMGILYQLSDTVFEEAVLESDEKAELSQDSFITILLQYGLKDVLSNPTAKEALLGKGKTSSNTPDVPVKVEPFMHWLVSGESNRGSAAKAAAPLVEKSKSAMSVKAATKQEETDGGDSSRSKPSSARATASVSASPRPDQSNEATPNPTASGTTGSGSARTVDTSHGKDHSSSLNIHTASADLSSRTGSQKSMLGAAISSARSALTAEDRETEEKKQEEYRQSLNYQPKEMEVSTITIEGEQLVHAFYDTVFVNFRIATQQQQQQQKEWNATTSMPREKGSKRRTFNIKWPEILISADAFQHDHVILTLAVADKTVTETNTIIPSLQTTEFGVSEHSIKIPLYHFLIPSFDVKAELTVPIIVATSSSTTTNTSKVNNNASNIIKLSIHGNSRDPKSVRTSRIMSMRPQELMNIKFDPIPLDDAEDLIESDDESTDSTARKSQNNRKETPKIQEEEEELTRTLFPKASIANMSTIGSSGTV